MGRFQPWLILVVLVTNQHVCVCCFVLLTRGWERFETRPPVALGSSFVFSAFTLSLAPPVHPSPIFLTDTENLYDVVQFQHVHAQGQFGVLGEVSESWKCLPTKRQNWWHSTLTTPTYYTASRMLNHHTHPTDPISDKKTNVFDTSMASPSRQHNFAVRVSHKCIVTVVEFGRSRQRSTLGMLGSWRFGVWALPP